LPQSGTVVAGIGLTALEGLISDVLHLENTDFASLVETRVILEIESARLASERRTENDLKDLQNALARYYDKINNNEPAVEEDMMFHLKIAEASKNSVLKSLMLIIIPDILTSYNKYKICTNDRLKKRHEEHMRLYDCIASKDGVAASASMREHLKDILKQGKEIIKQ
jgi:GntR family transcriptional regulator, transcriptional repressor for pyruvate dehydrogenase complex